MKRYFILTFFISFIANAQIGIGTSSPNAFLDVTSADGGVLIPNVPLASTTDLTFMNPDFVDTTVSPIIEEGTLVYNTNTVGTTILPGFYFYGNKAGSFEWIPYRDTTVPDDPFWSFKGTDTDNFFLDNTYVGGTSSAAQNPTGPKPTFFDTSVGTGNTDPIWVFNHFENSGLTDLNKPFYIGTNDNNPFILGANNLPGFLVQNEKLESIGNGSASRPVFTFYDAPQTGISLIPDWGGNDFQSKGRKSNKVSTTQEQELTKLVFSADGESIMEFSKKFGIVTNKPFKSTATHNFEIDHTTAGDHALTVDETGRVKMYTFLSLDISSIRIKNGDGVGRLAGNLGDIVYCKERGSSAYHIYFCNGLVWQQLD